jgi:glycosyltransferase involved in cell wall biosynthesis
MARRLRVVTLIDKPDVTGGGERMAVTLAMRVDPGRFDRFLCATRPSDGASFEGELRETGVRTLTLDRGSKLDLLAWRPLVSLLRRERIDILHAHKFGSNLWGAVIGRLARVPVVVAHEQSWASARYSFAGPRLRAFLDRNVIGRLADAFIAVSEADKQRMIDLEGVEADRIRVLFNAIPTQQPTGRDVRAELGIAPDAPVVATVCQLRAEKALDLLVDAAAELKREFPDLRVLIAGDGQEEAALREQIRERDLAETVLLLGTRRDIPDLLTAVDVAVCCSDFEGTPLSVMEYMASEAPVVATRVGGLPEMIDEGVHGLLFERRNVHELAEALARLLRDPGERRRMGERARERQRERFDLDGAARWLEALYEELYFASKRGRAEGVAPAGVAASARER